jgi:hypothetical protein
MIVPISHPSKLNTKNNITANIRKMATCTVTSFNNRLIIRR